jgi:hypothetical protein
MQTALADDRRMASSDEGPLSAVKPTFKCQLNGADERSLMAEPGSSSPTSDMMHFS